MALGNSANRLSQKSSTESRRPGSCAIERHIEVSFLARRRRQHVGECSYKTHATVERQIYVFVVTSCSYHEGCRCHFSPGGRSEDALQLNTASSARGVVGKRFLHQAAEAFAENLSVRSLLTRNTMSPLVSKRPRRASRCTA